MNKIQKLFKSKKFILLFSMTLTLISLILFRVLMKFPQIHFEIVIIPILSIIGGPVGLLGYIIVESIYIFLRHPNIVYFALVNQILIFLSFYTLWKLWYTIMNRHGYDVPNLGSIYNLAKLTVIYIIHTFLTYNLFNIYIFESHSQFNLSENFIILLPFNFFLIIFSIYLLNRYKIPVYTPKRQFKKILPKKAYPILLILIIVLGLIYDNILLNANSPYSIYMGAAIIILTVIYIFEPYDEEVFNIKDTASLNIFSKGNISIFLIILILLILLIFLPYVLKLETYVIPYKLLLNIFNTFREVFILIMIPVLIYLYFLEKRVTDPINTISETISHKISTREDYRKHKKALNSIESDNEIGTLVDSLLDMEDDFIRYGENLLKVSSEKERIETELKLAHEIQESMIPKDFEEFYNGFNQDIDDEKRFQVWGYMKAAREVGGDFYDYFKIDEDNIGFAIGKIDAKGISAALIIVEAMTLIQDYTSQYKDLSKALHEVNKIIYKDNIEKNNISCWLGMLNVKSGELSYINSGHKQPLIRLAGGDFEYMSTETDAPLSSMENTSFKTHSMKLNKDDAIFLYTNGIIEAKNKKKEDYGKERLRDELNKHKDDEPRKLIESAEEDLLRFCDGEEQFDDNAMLIVKIK